MGVNILEGAFFRRFVEAQEAMAEAQETMALSMSASIDVTDYREIQEIVRSGRAERYFAVGDQINVAWNPDGGETSYVMPWDVVDFGPVVDYMGRTQANAMWIQSHYALPGVQFSGNNAFYVPAADMPAGTYYFTMGNGWGTHVVNGKIYEFTTTKAVPKNGQLVLGTASSNTSALPDTNPSNWRVRTYKTGIQTDPDEILTLTEVESSSGTDLGTLSSSTKYSTSGINNMQRAAYGYNRWAHSAMRQWLNSQGAIGEWWEAQNPFDHRPDQLATMRGFMAGLPSEFLSIIKPVRVTTALNTISDVDIGTSENTIDRFFCAGLQQEYIAPQLADVEGATWEYWKERLENVQHAQGTTRPEHIRYSIENHASAQYVRLRSAHRGTAYHTWTASPSGHASTNLHATYAGRSDPACVIY